MNDEFIYCEVAEKAFSKTNKAVSHNGDISIDYLTNLRSPKVITGAREYQREKVASLCWKQQIMLTVLTNGYTKIPQIHIRVVKSDDTYVYELIDGQQRITSIIDFVNNKYALPNSDEFRSINGLDIRGKKFDDLPKSIKDELISYRISCIWYENLTDAQTAHLFIKVLNNSNTMKPQEIRNAVRGLLSTFIRNSSRFKDTRHDLFERYTKKTKNKNAEYLTHFSEGFTLAGRMEVDEWLSELIYMQDNGYRQGVSHQKHLKWIEFIQQTGKCKTKNEFAEFNETLIEPLVSFAYDIITSVPTNLKYKLTPYLSQILILYGLELKHKYGKLKTPIYTKKFFEVYDKWSNPTNKVYSNEIMWGTDKNGRVGEQMEPFNKLFGGKNTKAIGTITYILDKEVSTDMDSFGIVEIDFRETFSKPMKILKWEEQGKLDFFTNEPLELRDIAGDHYIPRSYGIKKGGVTEYHNLVITSKKLNNQKGAMHGDDFIKFLKNKK
tara:strand:+ start:311 stop:1795 length:1485 start_codon:yes stop_codon:yes gene_type:complete